MNAFNSDPADDTIAQAAHEPAQGDASLRWHTYDGPLRDGLATRTEHLMGFTAQTPSAA